MSKPQGYSKAIREKYTNQSHCSVVDEAEQKRCSFLLVFILDFVTRSDLMGSLARVGEGSSYFPGYVSQKEALAVAHSRWSLWEPRFVRLGRRRLGMDSDLYLAPVPFIASICQENLTP